MNTIINAFKEYKEFKYHPWDINTMYFPTDITTSPHYADTIEVLLCYNLIGTIYIGGIQFELKEQQVFFIPPNVVHSIYYKKSDGFVKVLKINPSQLTPYLHINNLLRNCSSDYFHFPAKLNEYEKVNNIATCFEKSDNAFSVCSSICELFSLLINHTKASPGYIIESSHNEVLKKVILWTEQNYLNKITIEEIANVVGYTKYHFCNKFKLLTGITYLNYLNNLRIYHACDLLKEDISIEKVSELCGFENTSYFIQLFKKITGTTPKKYRLIRFG
jgi:xylan 1,4-beta-xylosidase